MKELVEIQGRLKAPKNQMNKFGGYRYRSCEDILEAVKPLLKEKNCQLVLADEIVPAGSRFYVKATATLSSASGESVSVSAFAREAENKKGMDEAQITGTASSYARKYALNGLFLIDDAKDADTEEYSGNAPAKKAQPSPAQSWTKEQVEEMKRWSDGTFDKEELDKFKRDVASGDKQALYSAMSAEYKKRLVIASSFKETNAGASAAFDKEIF